MVNALFLSPQEVRGQSIDDVHDEESDDCPAQNPGEVDLLPG